MTENKTEKNTIKKTGVIPQNIEEQWRLAGFIFKSGMIPKSYESREAVFTAIQAGGEIGLSPFQAVQSFTVINGRPSIWGDAIPALVLASGNVAELKEVPIFDPNATDYIPHPGGKLVGYKCYGKRKDNGKTAVHEFTIDDAKRAGLWKKNKSPWITYPQRMLQMRARSWVCRDVWPDVLKGIAIAEEQIDMQEIIQILEEVAAGKQAVPTAGEAERVIDDELATEQVELPPPPETEQHTEPEPKPEPEQTKQPKQQAKPQQGSLIDPGF